MMEHLHANRQDETVVETTKSPCKLCNIKPKHLWCSPGEEHRCPFVRLHPQDEKVQLILQYADLSRNGSVLPVKLRLLANCYLFQEAMVLYWEKISQRGMQ